jgi:predicted GH43/DUF377 family glycosyl hydrolase
MKFSRISAQPFIPRLEGTFHSQLVANPDLLEFKECLYLFFRGQDERGHDQIGMWRQPIAVADGYTWEQKNSEPIIKVSVDPAAHDSNHILDPAAIEFNGMIYLYYTSKSQRSKNEYSISLAISGDGQSYEKYGSAPVLPGVIAPEVVYRDGYIYLFFQRHNVEKDCWEIYFRTSEDGKFFSEETERLVFEPHTSAQTIDSKSVATVRIFEENEIYYMFYAACKTFLDYPESIGMARSTDLISWERYPDNPVFTRGEIGQWDEGAIWYPTIYNFKGRYLMFYEGAGVGLGIESEDAQNASQKARNENYGAYLETSFSQIGLSFHEGAMPKW